MDSRRIPFITTTCESSESDNDVEPRTRLFRRQKNANDKKDSIAGGRASSLLPPSTVSLHFFVHGGTEEDEQNKYRAFSLSLSVCLSSPLIKLFLEIELLKIKEYNWNINSRDGVKIFEEPSQHIAEQILVLNVILKMT